MIQQEIQKYLVVLEFRKIGRSVNVEFDKCVGFT